MLADQQFLLSTSQSDSNGCNNGTRLPDLTLGSLTRLRFAEVLLWLTAQDCSLLRNAFLSQLQTSASGSAKPANADIPYDTA